MSGPIVRTGTNPKFWANYDAVFGAKKKATGTATPATEGEPKAAAKKSATKKAAAKKATKKKAAN